MTNDRAEAVKFTYPYLIDLVTFIYPAPTTRINHLNVFKPFDTKIWINILINIIILLILFKKRSLIIWIIITLLLRQQYNFGYDQRVWLCGWVLAGVVLTVSYAGVMFSIITTPFEFGRISTLNELDYAQKTGQITVIGVKDGIYYNMIKVTFLNKYFLDK